MSVAYSAELVYGVPITEEQREKLYDRFGDEADAYVWPYTYEGDKAVFGFKIVNGIEDKAVEVPMKIEEPIKEQAMIASMLEAVMDRPVEWKIYLLFSAY